MTRKLTLASYAGAVLQSQVASPLKTCPLAKLDLGRDPVTRKLAKGIYSDLSVWGEDSPYHGVRWDAVIGGNGEENERAQDD